MPPKRRRKSGDILEQVLESASLPHSIDVNSLKEQVEEELRVLNVRAPLKQLGKGDSLESRKLVLLQLQLKSKHDVSLKTQTLASAVGMKPAAFESLSVKASRYIGTSSSTNSSRKRTKSGLNQSVSESKASITTAAVSNTSSNSTILSLSIRLGSQVHDSHGFAQRARQLFRNIELYLRSTTTKLSNVKKRGYLEDMQRSRPTYEAACFYLVARGRKLKKTTSRNKNDDASLQDEEETQLTIQNVIDASSKVSASEFRDVLPTVEKFASEIENGRQQIEATESSRKRPVTGVRPGPKPKKKAKGVRKQDLESNVAARTLGERIESAVQFDTTASTEESSPVSVMPPAPIFSYSSRFLDWKKQVIREARERSTKVMDEEETGGAEGATEFAGMERAADDVLRRRRILRPMHTKPRF